MELKEFIKIALVDIIKGVSEAKIELEDKNGGICPVAGIGILDKAKLVHSMSGQYLQKVDFDIAVTTENASSKGGKAGIKVLGLNASIGKDVDSVNSSISRIKFHVPIGLSSKIS